MRQKQLMPLGYGCLLSVGNDRTPVSPVSSPPHTSNIQLNMNLTHHYGSLVTDRTPFPSIVSQLVSQHINLSTLGKRPATHLQKF